VRVTTRSGEAFERYIDRPLGRDRDHPLPGGTLQAKFQDCASQVLDPRSAASAAALLGDLENVAEIGAISRLLEGGRIEHLGGGTALKAQTA
jgi:hypothetical protein